jgi:hypothetical protein
MNKNIRVKNITSSKGNIIANQFEIWTDESVTFQSYKSIICIVGNDKIIFGSDWDYSRTTSKYLYIFLRDRGLDINNKKDVEKIIKEGEVSSRWNDYKVIYKEDL